MKAEHRRRWHGHDRGQLNFIGPRNALTRSLRAAIIFFILCDGVAELKAENENRCCQHAESADHLKLLDGLNPDSLVNKFRE
jgi:hypothetical protein